jgi:hypothetical protein
MPGVSSRQDVPGAHGVGKVRLRFKPISEKKKSRYGAVLFFFCLWLILFSISWSYPNWRYAVVVPLLQRTFGMFNELRRGFRPLNEFSASLSDGGRIYQITPGV